MPHILLVDDDDALRTMLRKTLVKFGHQVTEARDGKEALKLCAGLTPDLVLTDLIMPEKEGLEVVLTLRRSRPDVKIVAMSGGARINARDFLHIAKMMGAHQILEKPFSNEALSAAIQAALDAPPRA